MPSAEALGRALRWVCLRPHDLLHERLRPLDLLPRVGDLIPEADNRLVPALVFEGEHTHAGGSAVEEPPCPGGRPSHRAAIIRMMCPLENARTSPSMPMTRAMIRSARAATSSGDSPSGQPSRKAPRWAALSGCPEAPAPRSAVVPLDEVGIDRRDRSKTGEFASPRGTLKGLVKTEAKENRLSRSPN